MTDQPTKDRLSAPVEETSNAPSPADQSGHGRTILVADDESHILHVVSLKLRNAGYRVITAKDGQEALEIATAELPDLIITDYHMPQLSGLELCQRLKADPTTRHIPAVMLTARGYHLEPHDTEQSGIARMLSKPFSPRQLLSTVQELLGAAA
jgi:two-component system, OmpR family, alkaline phosphatase synthesis response regulator PhoP